MDINKYFLDMFKGIDDNVVLDDEQKDVILDDSKNTIVVAGAGAGKTTVITAKVKYLVDIKKVNPSDILIISFTKKAIEELKYRINDEFKLNIDISTFHSFAYKIIRNVDTRFSVDLNVNNYLRDLIKKDKNTKDMIKYVKKDIICKRCMKKANSDFDFFLSFSLENIALLKMRSSFTNNKVKYCKYYDYLSNLLRLYYEYANKNYCLDFEDMINMAIKYLDDYKNNYKYIIIDEFQDISYSRYNLIKKISTLFNTSILVVGDDWQSIYSFAGSDVNLFLNFKFEMNAKLFKITNTYRNSQNIIDVAGSFVMENKRQIVKELHSNKQLLNPIKIYVYKNNFGIVLKKIIDDIVSKFGLKKSILLLGRYKCDINKILDADFIINNDKVIYKKYKNLSITFLTIHSSKGLGFDNVILLNACNSYLGFPNEKEESIIRKQLLPSEEKIYEERRLFYVAITRTKNYFYIMQPRKNQSSFVKELACKYKIDIYK